ncbi:hypothetical protein Tco_0596834 [Tanacetum coccineum]
MRLSIKRGGDSVQRDITTDARLDAAQDSNNLIRTQTTAMPNVDIPQRMDTEGHTSGSGESSMEYHFELTVNVPPTPHDSPLSGGNTPGSDEGGMELIEELMETCTSLTKRVLALDEAKTAQDRGRSSDKTKPITARPEVSAATPSTPPTTTTVFNDEDVTMAMAQTLINMKEVKANEKGVEFRNVEGASRPPKKVKRRDQGLAQIESDVELAQRLHEEEFDEIQARIDADSLFAAKLQQEEREKFTIEERA